MWSLEEVNEKQFFKDIYQSDKPVFIFFWGVWCPSCRMVYPLITPLVEEYNQQVDFIKVNVDANKKIAREFDVAGVPAFAIVHKGKKLEYIVGACSKIKLSELINKTLEEIVR